MKKFALVGIALMLAAFCVSLSSCSDDDKDRPEYTTPTLITEMDLDLDDDYFEFCDVSMTYTDFTGKVVTEPVTSRTDWKRVMTTATFPATASYKLNIALKTPVPTPTRAKYDLDADLDFEANGYMGKSRYVVQPEVKYTLCTRENVPAAEVIDVIKSTINNANSLNLNYTFGLQDNVIVLTSPL